MITGLIGAKRVGDMERVLPNLKRKLIIDGAGHWIQQERADESMRLDRLSQGSSVKPAAGQQFARPCGSTGA